MYGQILPLFLIDTIRFIPMVRNHRPSYLNSQRTTFAMRISFVIERKCDASTTSISKKYKLMKKNGTKMGKMYDEKKMCSEYLKRMNKVLESGGGILDIKLVFV